MLLEEILNANLQYQEKASEVKALYQELCQLNDQLDLEEVRTTMSYKEAKQLFELVKYATNDSTKVNALKALVQAKKEEKYPEILGVHYYPELKQFTQLSESEQIALDRQLRNHGKNSYKAFRSNLSEDVLQALVDLKILQRAYAVSCRCHGHWCDSHLLTEEQRLRYIDYWQREAQGEEISDEEYDELDGGCLSIYCNRKEDVIEIYNLDTLNRHSREYLYLEKEPDLTLEEL